MKNLAALLKDEIILRQKSVTAEAQEILMVTKNGASGAELVALLSEYNELINEYLRLNKSHDTLNSVSKAAYINVNKH